MDTPTQDIPDVEPIYSIEDIIKQVEASGINLGDNPSARINTFIDYGLLPQPKNGNFSSWAVQRIIAIQSKLYEGKSLQDLKDEVSKERRRFLNQVTDLNSMVHLYKKFSSNSMFFLASLLLLGIVSFGFLAAGLTGTTNPIVVASENIVKAATNAGKTVARTAAKPIGQTIVTIIKTSKDENSTSADPLELTNLEIDTPVIPENLVQLDSLGNLNIGGDIVAATFAGSGKGLTDLDWDFLVNRPSVLAAVDSVSNDGGNIDLIAGIGISINPDDDNNTITIGSLSDFSSQFIFKNIAVSGQSSIVSDLNSDTLTLSAGSNITLTTDANSDTLTISSSGGSSNADTLDTLDSTAFLRSNSSTGFSSGTLTMGSGTTLSVLGTFSCADCVGDSAIPNTITATNYLLLSGGTVSGVSVFSSTINPGLRVGDLNTGYFKVGGSTIYDNSGNLIIDSDNATLQFSDQTLLLDDGFSTTYIINTRTNAGNNILAIQNPGLGILDTRLEGNLLLNGDWAISTSILDIPNSYTFQVRDQTNVLFSIADAGTTGNATITGTLDVNGGTISSTASQLILQATGTNADILIQGGLCIRDATACPDVAAGGLQVDTAGGSADDPGDVFDFAEIYDSTEALEQGDVVTASGERKIKRSDSTYDQGVIGIVSTHPAAMINEGSFSVGVDPASFNPNKPWVALAGRVPTKVSTENGNIEPGDPLTSSSTPGVAMKATESGPIIGKALESFDGAQVGKVMVFVSTGWYVAPLSQDISSKLSDLSQIDLETLNSGSINTQVLFVGDRKLTMTKNGRLKIDGDVEISGAVLAEQIVTDELVVSNKTSGSGTVAGGENSQKISNNLVKASSKILVTFEGDYSPATRYWVEKEKGLGFTVKLDQPPSSNTSFSWVVIN